MERIPYRGIDIELEDAGAFWHWAWSDASTGGGHCQSISASGLSESRGGALAQAFGSIDALAAILQRGRELAETYKPDRGRRAAPRKPKTPK
ncbi:MAG TPA: hypothetical protein VHM90_00510 [Phycisphaerae bacterium]|nr:hypothetical protein [Phycisphaerae bacterium]